MLEIAEMIETVLSNVENEHNPMRLDMVSMAWNKPRPLPDLKTATFPVPNYASVRRDGSSKFADGNRWGTFPSVSLGWNWHFHELLDLLSSTTYQVPGKNIGIPEDTVQITLDPHARVFFHSGGRHMELILPGNLILVNPLAFPGKSRTYLPDGNQEFQQEVIAFLESCQNGA